MSEREERSDSESVCGSIKSLNKEKREESEKVTEFEAQSEREESVTEKKVSEEKVTERQRVRECDNALTISASESETRKWMLVSESKLFKLMSENPDKLALGGTGTTRRKLPEKVSLKEEAQRELIQRNRERSPSKITKFKMINGEKVRVK